MSKLLKATGGKVFTLETLDYLVRCTDLEKFRSKGGPSIGSSDS
jgi:hypothetical protein